MSEAIKTFESSDSDKIAELLNQRNRLLKQVQQKRKSCMTSCTDQSLLKPYEKHVARFEVVAKETFAARVELKNGKVLRVSSIQPDFMHGTVQFKYKTEDGRSVHGQFYCYGLIKREVGKLHGKYTIGRSWKHALTLTLNHKQLTLDVCADSDDDDASKFLSNAELREFVTHMVDLEKLDSIRLSK